MFRISKPVMMIALMLLLLQTLAPALTPFAAGDTTPKKTTSYHLKHEAFVAPILLKELDEKENSDFLPVFDSTALLDFTRHGFNIVASHNIKHARFSDLQESQPPPRMADLCKFLI